MQTASEQTEGSPLVSERRSDMLHNDACFPFPHFVTSPSPSKIKVAKQKNFLYCPFCLILVNSLFLPFYLSLVYINFEQLSAVFEIIHICVCACVYSNKRQRTARKLCLWMKSENELCVTESDAAAERE